MAKKKARKKLPPIKGAKNLIDARGGYRQVADALGWPLSTVNTFVRNDAAPKYRWDAIVALPIVGAQRAAA